ncbi:hypothetical protein GCM10009577_88540 [Streptomyces javensis]
MLAGAGGGGSPAGRMATGLGRKKAKKAVARDASFRPNVITPVALCNAVLPRMTAAGQGRIVNVSTGVVARPGRPVTHRPTRTASGQARSNRSRFMTLTQAAAKSWTNFSLASSLA